MNSQLNVIFEGKKYKETEKCNSQEKDKMFGKYHELSEKIVGENTKLP